MINLRGLHVFSLFMGEKKNGAFTNKRTPTKRGIIQFCLYSMPSRQVKRRNLLSMNKELIQDYLSS